MPHKKKVNKLSKKECQSILAKLSDSNKESQYYKHIEIRLKFIDDTSK